MDKIVRVIGIDPGTVSFDVCGLEGGHLFLDTSLPTSQLDANPKVLVDLLQEAGPVDMIVGPSGYGLPWIRARDLRPQDIDLLVLSEKRKGGRNTIVGGMRRVLRLLQESELPVYFVPAVIHLPTVPQYRKVNRIDMGTADKLCAVALGIYDQARHLDITYEETSFIYIELGGAFTAVIAVEQGKVVDGLGGTSGSLGYLSLGAMDGELAYLLGSFHKEVLCTGGLAYIAMKPDLSSIELAGLAQTDNQGRMAWTAFFEHLVKSVAAEMTVVPAPREILISGRLCHIPEIYHELTHRLSGFASVRRVEGFAQVAKEAAQGAVLMAEGLAGGTYQSLVETMSLRQASGTVLDHLYVAGAEALKKKYTLP